MDWSISPSLLASASKPEVIIITGQGEADGAEKAVVSGAWSYIEKPYVIRELSLQLTRVLQYRREKQKVVDNPRFPEAGHHNRQQSVLSRNVWTRLPGHPPPM